MYVHTNIYIYTYTLEEMQWHEKGRKEKNSMLNYIYIHSYTCTYTPICIYIYTLEKMQWHEKGTQEKKNVYCAV